MIRRLVVLAAIGVALAPLPLLLPPAQEAVAVRALMFAMMAVAWNLMSGFGGLFSFGHAAYFGLGAYTTALLTVELGLSPWLGLLAGMAVAALFGVVTGYLAVRYRLKGAYFALATFAFAEMLRLAALNSELVGGAVGLTLPVTGEQGWWTLRFDVGDPAYFWVALLLTLACVATVIVLLGSRAGLNLVAVREDETAAAAAGVAVVRHKILAIGVSAALTSVAGGFYAVYYLFVSPDLAFGPSVSIQAILPAVIGGVGTVWGPLIGAAVLAPLSDVAATVVRTPPEFLSFLQGRSGLDVIMYAVLLIVVVLAMPRGLYGGFARRSR
ncbi:MULTISPECIES: branched-chain amino acid ABC transporter permease [Nonomuraea]|uniref:Branched-chain amino acid ABC transporter permease n=1 Tax=Nonomuraea ferruginea TaxID=46174 RepID=A0ABT4STF8_9ACTN|nr:branched-chain amino acid ABC transporter permease [Nonomuraea ferruginea]MDA0640424.1 branched-chain amino acid ABC transporter permease [Nonomuraea ferruginea]